MENRLKAHFQKLSFLKTHLKPENQYSGNAGEINIKAGIPAFIFMVSFTSLGLGEYPPLNLRR
jgi:hypothetical protein